MSPLAMPNEILAMILTCDSEDKGQLYRTSLVKLRLASLIGLILSRIIDLLPFRLQKRG